MYDCTSRTTPEARSSHRNSRVSTRNTTIGSMEVIITWRKSKIQ
jgi:hypothetical protein